ncbi:BUB3-interacting and GLEBS motif-containing protein ZNF207 [Fasciola hepatica]|uniref:BUB3-interacting and GLEBS motif-containing protein ZNF207 n=1 Tax=Fasciola hepatica TaxID=6192 RepID=A0A4E0R126_FASHE|nr:BUB3-interacting and GLEBS motif-containing protein ZNF207 [Fasciola hepatica]
MGRKKRKQLKPWCWWVVHKEKLDKIPNALPNRTSTVIDIYGMVGVPEVDLIEHERLKLGIEAEEPPEKVSKTEESSSFFPPALPFLPGVTPLNPYAHVGGKSHLPSQFGWSTVVPGVPMPPPLNVPAPPPPLPTSTPADQSPANPKPTFPAYSSPGIATKPQVPKVPKPTSGVNGVSVELVHPSDDLSLEELRAETGRYKKLLEAANAPPPPPIPTAPLTRPAIPPVIAPGLMAPMAVPHGTHLMYPGMGHPLVPQVPIACAPGFIPSQTFGLHATQSQLPPSTQMPPWTGMPPLRF